MTALAMLALFAAACASDGGRGAGAGDGGEPAPSAPDAAVLRAYVEALAGGDIEATTALRCRGGQWKGYAPGSPVQPAGEPPFSDWVYLVAGDVGVQVAVNQSEPDAPISVAEDIARQVAGLAG